MKGVMSFLEKAGLVKNEPAVAQEISDGQTTGDAMTPPTPFVMPATTGGDGAALKLDQIYANAGIVVSSYPAERLLRLVDGLSAMDEATRLMAIKAMDAADESWTIEDPLADAAIKVKALNAHAQALQLNMQALERDTQTQLDATAASQAQVISDIKKQIAELEALVSRELARTAQETATHEANLNAAKSQAARELGEIAQISQRLQGLSAQFGTPAATPQKD